MNQIIETLKSYQLWSNSAYEYVLALLIFISTIVVLKIFQSIVLAKLKKMAEKTKTEFDDVLIKIFREIKPPFYFFIALYFGIKVLEFPDIVSKVINILFLIIIVYEIIRAFEKIVDFGVKKYVEKADGKQVMSPSMVKALKIILKIILWAIGLILVLGNLGIDVTSLIAGLGIGGIAIAFALQNILEDIFSSFSIYVDKPFRVGDYIVVGKDSGTVEKIGLKTSRLRTLSGEELVVSNKELTNARVQNFRKMESRRDSFTLGIVYDTPSEKLEKVPQIIEEIVSGFDNLEFVRCKFTEFGDSSLNFDVVYLVNSKDFDLFAEMKQKINFEIYKRFKRENIEFAYPTQTIFVNK